MNKVPRVLIVDANPAAAEYYGWSREELCQKNISEINSLSPKEIREELARAWHQQRRRFPVDCLKIDRSFISDVAEDPSATAVVKSIVAIARSLDLKSVAEGVETQAQLGFLRQCGCNGFQGYYFSRPLPAGEFAALLRERRGLN